MELEILLAVRVIIIVLLLAAFVTQVLVPILRHKPTFPILRSKQPGEVFNEFDEYRKREIEKEIARATSEQEALALEEKLKKIKEEVNKQRERVRNQDGSI